MPRDNYRMWFLSNGAEAAKLITLEYEKKIAEIICDGLIEYFNVEKDK